MRNLTRFQLQAIRQGRLTRANACGDKHAYSQDRAIRLAERRREETEDPTWQAYPCLFCQQWHLGHSKSHAATIRADRTPSATLSTSFAR